MPNRSSRSNSLLTIFFAIAVFLELGYLLIGLASNLSFYRRVTSQSVEPKELYGQVMMSNAIIAQNAIDRHLSLEAYAVYRIVSNSIAALIPVIIAILIIWRARWQWFAWFTAFVLLFLGQYSLNEQTVAAGLIPLRLYGANDIFWFLILLFVFLFPNGRVVPRRLGWVVIGLVVYHFFIQAGTVVAYFAPEFAAQTKLPNWGSTLYIIPVLINFLIVLACQIYRYRRVSTPVERQQTKWFLFGFAVVIVLVLVSMISGNRGGFLADIASVYLFTPLPIAVGIAILRYRLWDIDILIRRTLLYGLLTAFLSLVYFGSVILLQTILQPVTGQVGQSPLTVVMSTLLIAALFIPIRRRLQNFIDRRFYRRKYNTEKVLAEFNTTLKNEVDLDRLTNSILEVVDETMQPAYLSLWMRKPRSKGRSTGDA